MKKLMREGNFVLYYVLFFSFSMEVEEEISNLEEFEQRKNEIIYMIHIFSNFYALNKKKISFRVDEFNLLEIKNKDDEIKGEIDILGLVITLLGTENYQPTNEEFLISKVNEILLFFIKLEFLSSLLFDISIGKITQQEELEEGEGEGEGSSLISLPLKEIIDTLQTTNNSKLNYKYKFQFQVITTCYFTFIPSSISKFTNLTYLDISPRAISETNIDFLFQLTNNLEGLSLPYFPLPEITPKIGLLRNLKTLRTYGSRLFRFPRTIKFLENLMMFSPYTSLNLHFFPVELLHLNHLNKTTISCRHQFGAKRDKYSLLPNSKSIYRASATTLWPENLEKGIYFEDPNVIGVPSLFSLCGSTLIRHRLFVPNHFVKYEKDDNSLYWSSFGPLFNSLLNNNDNNNNNNNKENKLKEIREMCERIPEYIKKDLSNRYSYCSNPNCNNVFEMKFAHRHWVSRRFCGDFLTFYSITCSTNCLQQLHDKFKFDQIYPICYFNEEIVNNNYYNHPTLSDYYSRIEDEFDDTTF